MICSTLWTEDLNNMYETKAYDTKGSEWTVEEVDDSGVFFSPERGNVAFASTGDGWGFRLVFLIG